MTTTIRSLLAFFVALFALFAGNAEANKDIELGVAAAATANFEQGGSPAPSVVLGLSLTAWAPGRTWGGYGEFTLTNPSDALQPGLRVAGGITLLTWEGWYATPMLAYTMYAGRSDRPYSLGIDLAFTHELGNAMVGVIIGADTTPTREGLTPGVHFGPTVEWAFP